jgi:hypothetical protein
MTIAASTRAERKAANIAAHDARNADAKAKGIARRGQRAAWGLSRSRDHNARLKTARLDALRESKGMKPYEISHEQALAFEDTSNESGDMATYEVPGTLEAFTASLPGDFVMTDDDEIEIALDGSTTFVAMVDEQKADSFTLDVDFVLLGIPDAEDVTMLLQKRTGELHEHLISLGAQRVPSRVCDEY